MTHGFPIFFTMSIAQTRAAVNYVPMADKQTQTIVHVIKQSMSCGAKDRRAFLETCTPGYYNYEGKRDRSAGLNDFYAAAPMAYARLLDQWPKQTELPGLPWGMA